MDPILEKYGKLIQKDSNGTYCLLFSNRHALQVKEIRDIFSQFGEVYSVNVSGTITGYRFVRYKNAFEVENAIKGLKNHPKILLCEFKKIRPENRTSNLTINEINYSRDPYAENYKFKNQETDYKHYYINTSNQGVKNNALLKRAEDNTWNSVNKNEEKNEALTLNNKDKNILHLLTEANSKFNRRNLSDSKIRPTRTIENYNDIPNLISSNGNVFFGESTNTYNTVSIKAMTTQMTNDPDNIPDLITTKNKTLPDKKDQIIKIHNAVEVVVGNIHPDYSPAYILHMFDKFEPIAITNIYCEPNSGVQYCHVYFKNEQDAFTVEYLFDKTPLAGQNLIILRPSKLLEEIQL